MLNLLPYFINDKYKNNIFRGKFSAVTVFMDMSGFTNMTETLMKKSGKAGAEVLSNILNNIFEPIIDDVTERNGFVSGFAGDAMTIIFPVNNDNKHIVSEQACSCALFIRNLFEEKGLQVTEYGNFTLSVKLGLSTGLVEWGILGTENHRTYYFKGSAIDGCAKSEHLCEKMNIVLDKAFKETLHNNKEISTIRLNNDYWLLKNSNLPENKIVRTLINKEIDKEVVSKFFQDEVLNFNYQGEFRNIVSVFVSFDGYDDYSELNKFISAILKNAYLFGGYFNTLDFGDKGGTALILFGAPVSYEDDVKRAISFIQEIKAEFKNNIRVGIVTGITYTGIVGSSKRCTYTAIGDTVNLSARFMMKAEWGDILICEKVAKRIERQYNLESLGAFLFKGKSLPIQVFRLIGQKQISLSQLSEGEIFGRNLELNLLKEYSKPILNSKFAGVVYLYGEAGSGKSRLAFDFTKELNQVETINLQADNILKKSLNPFITFFEDFFKQTGTKTIDEKKILFEKIYDNFLKNLTTLSNSEAEKLLKELEREKSIIGALLGLHWENSIYERLPLEDIPTVTSFAIRDFFKAYSLIKPIIIVVEDAHFIDNDSLEVFRNLTRASDNYPMFILFISRFNDDGSKPKFNIDEKVIQREITIKNLSDEPLIHLIENRLGCKADKKLLSLIKDKTNGNPFFVEQLCLYLRENNLISIEGNISKLKYSDIDIPMEINTILISRIDRLSQQLKEVIQIASVIGKEFDTTIFKGMFDFSEELLSNPFSKELKAENIEIFLSEGEQEKIWTKLTDIKYIFKNALMSEVAYNMLLIQRLRNFHKIAGKVFENAYQFDKIHYADIAYHYDKGKEVGKAKEYFIKAGEFSKENYNNDKAIEYYNKALMLCSDKPENNLEIANLNSHLGDVYYNIGSFNESISYYTKTLDLRLSMLGEQHSDTASSYHSLSNVYWNIGDYDKALLYSNNALEIEIRNLGEKHKDTALSYNSIGFMYITKSEYDKAMEYLNKALNILIETVGENNPDTSLVYSNIGLVYWYKGDYDKTLYYTNKALTISLKAYGENHPRISELYNNIGMVYWNKSEYDKAIEYIKKCINIISNIFGNSHPNLAILYNNIGLVYSDKGDYNIAIDYLNESLKIRLETLGEDHPFTAFSYSNLGKLYYNKNDYNKAINYLEKSLLIREAIDDKANVGFDYTYLSQVFIKLKKYKEALIYAKKQFYNIEEIGIDVEHGKSYLSIALILKDINNCTDDLNTIIKEIRSLTGLLDTPENYFEASIKTATETNYYHTLIQALYEYGHYLYNIGKKQNGIEKISEAISLAKDRGMKGEIQKMYLP